MMHDHLRFFLNSSTYFLQGIDGIAPKRVMHKKAEQFPNSIDSL